MISSQKQIFKHTGNHFLQSINKTIFKFNAKHISFETNSQNQSSNLKNQILHLSIQMQLDEILIEAKISI